MDRLHAIGYDAVHPADFVYDVPPEPGTCLLIMTTSPARFVTGGESRVLPEHQAALFTSETPIRYGACGQEYRNDWMVLTWDEALGDRFPLMGEPFPVTDPEFIHHLFQLLTWEHRQARDEAVISQLMTVLFLKLRSEIRQDLTEPYERELMTLRRKILNQPQAQWRVADMAAMLHLSEGYLQLLYKKRFGVSCMEDVIRGRLRLAGDYLRHSSMNVSEIAALCGYHSAEHFSRQFCGRMGQTPGEYRAGAKK